MTNQKLMFCFYLRGVVPKKQQTMIKTKRRQMISIISDLKTFTEMILSDDQDVEMIEIPTNVEDMRNVIQMGNTF